MADDIRYSELVFLRALANRSWEYSNPLDENQRKAVGLPANTYADMVATLIEDLHVRFEKPELQLLVGRLRGEVPHNYAPGALGISGWYNPREGIARALTGQPIERLSITYRGLRRIEELREVLKRDRILEPFGALLSMQYFRNDLEDALRRTSDVTVSVLCIDMDGFKAINDQFGHGAGDVVMKAYLEAVRDRLGLLGEAYRGVGDEVAALVIGQGHQRAVELAESVRAAVAGLRCEYKGKALPLVTASIGVVTTPPEPRAPEIESLAEQRERRAKDEGKNRVVSG